MKIKVYLGLLVFFFSVFQLQAEDQHVDLSNFQITRNHQPMEKDQWLVAAYAAYQQGDHKTALQKYAKVLETDPANRNALLARAAIAIQNNDTAAAISDYQQLLLANPKDSVALSSLISVAYIAPEQAETQLKLMIREEPDSPYLSFALANIYSVQNRWAEARRLYFTALKYNPQNPNYAYNLAVSLEHMAETGKAIFFYRKAISDLKNGFAVFDKALVNRRIETLKNR